MLSSGQFLKYTRSKLILIKVKTSSCGSSCYCDSSSSSSSSSSSDGGSCCGGGSSSSSCGGDILP